MRQNKVDKFISEYCGEKRIKLLIDPNLDKDNGLCYPMYKEIHLSKKYTNTKIKLAVFLHEVGHIISGHGRKKPFNTFESELMSWQSAIDIHKKVFGRYFSKTQTQFMLKCLKTYCRSQYEFRRLDIEETQKENT